MPTPLPPGWSIRPPTLDDVPAILAMVHASDIAAVGEADFTSDEVVETLTAPGHDSDQDFWLVLDDHERTAGWAYLDSDLHAVRQSFDAYVHPEYGRPAHPVLLERVLARIVARVREAGVASVVVRAGAIASEKEYIGLLHEAGFTFVKRYARMRRELDGLPAVPPAQAGVVVRPVRSDDDGEMRAFHEVLDVAFRDTPDHEPSTYESFRLRLAAMQSIEWDEWFVAEVEGRIGGVLQSSGAETDEGWVKSLAVRREFRGRGLGRLLLLTAFASYAAKGRRAAGLGVDLTNPTGAYGLYESVGMRAVYESDVYERVVSAQSTVSVRVGLDRIASM